MTFLCPIEASEYSLGLFLLVSMGWRTIFLGWGTTLPWV